MLICMLLDTRRTLLVNMLWYLGITLRFKTRRIFQHDMLYRLGILLARTSMAVNRWHTNPQRCLSVSCVADFNPRPFYPDIHLALDIILEVDLHFEVVRVHTIPLTYRTEFQTVNNTHA